MKGDKEELPARTINKPIKSRTIIRGSSQNFFLTLKNCHMSLKNSN